MTELDNDRGYKPSPTFRDNLYQQATEYADMYKLPDSFTWYVMGAAWHTVGMSSSMIPDYLDSMRVSFSEMREHFQHTGKA